jgi:hypothetical protein
MGNLQDAIDVAAKMVGISGRPNVIRPKKRLSIWELLMRDMASAIIDVLNEKGYDLNSALQIK